MGTRINSRFVKIMIVCPPIIFYSLLILDKEIITLLTREDGFIESLGSLFFLLCSILFLICLKVKKNILYLFIGLLFLFGFLEEISWGQRIFEFQTPKFFQEYNLQKEFNIHNLKWFHGRDASGATKSFWGKLVNVDRLFSAFWFIYCVIIPILYIVNSQFAGLIKRFRIPTVPIFVGVIFLLNYIVSKGLEFNFPDLASRVTEIKETNFAYLFFLFSVFEFKNVINE